MIPCVGVSVLCGGQLKLFCTSSEGRRMFLKTAFPGDISGLNETLSGNSYEVSAQAVGSTVIKNHFP
jgi:CRP/FNR family cyclic AMP-dependent transcriptional regulator